MRLLRTTVISAIAIGLLGSSAAGVTAQESEAPADGVAAAVVSPGPFGKPYTDWAAEWWQERFGDCATGEGGDVFFLPAQAAHAIEQVDCIIADGQYLLAILAAEECIIDQTLIERAEKAKGKKARDLRRRVGGDAADLIDCIDGLDEIITDPFLSIDGEAVTLGDAYLTTSTPFDRGPFRVWVRGYFVMIEPLEVGSHTIEVGFTEAGHFARRGTINAEVVGTLDG